MRVYVLGDGDTAKRLRSLLARDCVLSEGSVRALADIAITFREPEAVLAIDAGPGALRDALIRHVGELAPDGSVRVDVKAGESFSERHAIVHVPADEHSADAAERGVYRALLELARPTRRETMGHFLSGARRAIAFLASCAGVLAVLVLTSIAGERLYAQLQQSGGPGSSVSIVGSLPAGSSIIGKVTTDQTTHGTTDLVAADVTKIGGNAINTGNGTAGTGTQRVAIASDQTAFSVNAALSAGSNIIGFVRVLPAGCTQTTRFSGDTVSVATGAGTAVTASTTCVTQAYANNKTNSAVTLQLADKQGTPVIWLGGNADFTIPANSNVGLPIAGIVFTSGIQAIAGTTTAVNLHVEGYQ
jgi:hypothetical protein